MLVLSIVYVEYQFIFVLLFCIIFFFRFFIFVFFFCFFFFFLFCVFFFFFFFFSSRRRHTRWTGDWSSECALPICSIKDEARHLCVPDGIPRILGNPYPFKIIHTPGQTTIAYELNRVFRIVMMDKPQESAHDLEILPYYSGHSVGHWDGDTLVVETAGFNEKTFLDATGAPHSDQMTTVERIRKINGGKQLEDVVTVTDPELLTKPFSARFVYDPHPEIRLQDYVCGEPHRDISQVPGVTEARRARTQG